MPLKQLSDLKTDFWHGVNIHLDTEIPPPPTPPRISLPNDKILDQTKLKAFADDTFNVAQMLTFVFDRIDNIVGKGEKASYHYFPLFPQCLQKASFSGSLKVGNVFLYP